MIEVIFKLPFLLLRCRDHYLPTHCRVRRLWLDVVCWVLGNACIKFSSRNCNPASSRQLQPYPRSIICLFCPLALSSLFLIIFFLNSTFHLRFISYCSICGNFPSVGIFLNCGPTCASGRLSSIMARSSCPYCWPWLCTNIVPLWHSELLIPSGAPHTPVWR